MRLRQRVATGVAVLAVPLLGGCGSGAPSAGGTPSVAASVSAPPLSVTSSPAPTTSAPAGQLIDDLVWTVRAPLNAVIDPPNANWQRLFHVGKTSGVSANLGATGCDCSLEPNPQVIDTLATSALKYGPPHAHRVADITLGGNLFYHLVNNNSVRKEDIYGSVHDGRLLSLWLDWSPAFMPKSKAAPLLQSILDSVSFK